MGWCCGRAIGLQAWNLVKGLGVFGTISDPSMAGGVLWYYRAAKFADYGRVFAWCVADLCGSRAGPIVRGSPSLCAKLVIPPDLS